jgi:phosphoribosylanthranilate isomerase
MTWVKICGITNLEDARVAAEAGADALGFVFYEKSPRRVDAEKVREIIRQLPKDLEKVGVFVHADVKTICETVDRTGINAVQVHGDHEDPHVVDQVSGQRPDLRFFVAISMRQPNPGGWAMMWQPDIVQAFLLDSGSSSQLGGTGERFDWEESVPVSDAIKRFGRTVVAGGLTPQNVAEAIAVLRPFGVDVSSGVEASPGKKDPEKVRAFVQAVRAAEKVA